MASRRLLFLNTQIVTQSLLAHHANQLQKMYEWRHMMSVALFHRAAAEMSRVMWPGFVVLVA